MAGQSTTQFVDSRTNADDTILFRFISYTTNITESSPVLIGLRDLDSVIVNADDSLVTELNRSTVDAYTDLGTSQKIYDAFKSELVGNYTGQTSTILGRVGDQIDLDQTATSLIIDATAVNVRDLTGSTATVKASTYTGGAATTASGTVTTRNGALLSGGTFDCDVNYESGASTTLTNVTVNGILDFDTAGTYTLDGCTISEVTNSSGGNITLTLLNGATVTTNTGPNITLNQPVNITASNIIDGSRVQIYNVTKSAELDNSVVSGGSGYSLEVNLLSSAVDIGDTIRLRATYQSGTTARKPLLSNNVITVSGLSFIDTQEDLTAYGTLGVDGSTVTEYNIDSNTGHLQIDANDSDCESTKKRIVARYYYLITTADGIDRFFNAIVLEDEANAVIDRSVSTLMLDNIGNCTLNLTDNEFRLYTSDNSSWIQDPPTGGYGVISDSGKVYAVNQDQIETIVNAIKAKTDLFTFTGNDVKATLDGEQVVASNMRGTDGANTVAPDNAGIAQIQIDISNLNDTTAAEVYTEFTSGNNEDAFKADVSSLATEANATANTNSIITEVNTNETKLDTIDTNVDSILEDTSTTIPNQISGLNDISTAEVKAQADQALTDYDPPTKAELDTAETNITNAIPTAGSVADAVWDEPYSQHTTAGSFGKLMDLLRKANRAIDGEVTGTPTVSSFSTNLTGYTNGAFDHELIVFVSGTLNGEARPILEYSGGTFTFEEQWTQAPSPGDEFVILPYHTHPISEIQEGLSTFDPSTDVVQNVDTVQTTVSNTDMRGTDGANTVTPPSVNDIQNGLAKRSELQVVNEGVKKASKIIPHNTDIKKKGELKKRKPSNKNI